MRQTRQFLFVAAALLAALLIAPAAHAQIAWNANIPFDFTVADTTLPAGDYLVQEVDQNDPSTFALTDRDRGIEVLFKTAPAAEQRPGDTPRLTFDATQGQAFLTGISIPGEQLHRDVLPGDKYESAKDDQMAMEEKVITLVISD